MTQVLESRLEHFRDFTGKVVELYQSFNDRLALPLTELPERKIGVTLAWSINALLRAESSETGSLPCV
jgi:hypothetical protein